MVNPGKEVLDDLCMRFVLNCPEEELRSWERLLFQVEQAHWFYEDHVRPENTQLRSFSLKDFVKTLFTTCSVLKPYKAQVADILAQFNAYKSLVPVMGAIILDQEMEHCLLLRGVKNSATWGFPKGKVDQDEADIDCAVREVREETSLDISGMISEENSVELEVGGQRRKMYFVAGVDRQTLFAPKMRGEVGNYAWMPISELPTKYKAEGAGVITEDDGKFKFWQVWMYVKPLKAWIKRQKQKKKQKAKLVVLKRKPTAASKAPPAASEKDTLPRQKKKEQGGKASEGGASPGGRKGSLLQFRFDRGLVLAAFDL